MDLTGIFKSRGFNSDEFNRGKTAPVINNVSRHITPWKNNDYDEDDGSIYGYSEFHDESPRSKSSYELNTHKKIVTIKKNSNGSLSISENDPFIVSNEEEIELIKTYLPDEDYLDRFGNRIHTEYVTTTHVGFILNKHLPKKDKRVIKLSRTDFLIRMGFAQGTNIYDYVR